MKYGTLKMHKSVYDQLFALNFLKLLLIPFPPSYTGSHKKKDDIQHDTRKIRLWCKEKGMRFFPFVGKKLSTRIL